MAIASDRLLRAVLPVAAALARPLIFLLARTWRCRWVAGEERLGALLAAGRPAVFVFWHHGLYSAGYPVLRRLLATGAGAASLVSQSRDGDLAARLARPLDLALARGSTSRGGLAGLRHLRRLLLREGRSVFAAPDGPRGPARVARPGTIILAQTTGAPLVPVAAVANRAWRLGSWDRLVVPKPFARVALAVGEPRELARSADPQEESRRLGETLDALELLCEGAIGGPRSGGD
ncbi:MAG: DUF374 domain-containing protein [Thermoanaerobaculia bacterium]|nr:DUF374 domain-containing protein [Thermoanaerobaculia bacterium]